MLERLTRYRLRVVSFIERAARRYRRQLEARQRRPAQTERPNLAEDWAKLYAQPVTPVTRLHSPVALVLEKLSRPGDVLLETGCGSASISAELAVAGRVIELADFSPPILERAAALFAASGLPAPVTRFADLTKPLPWADRAVDVTWSSGVLEHWTDDEVLPMLREMRRISRRRVVSFVPCALSVFYRWGKAVAEDRGTWSWGRELPRDTQRPVFERAGLRNVSEEIIWGEAACEFLAFIEPELRAQALQWWDQLPPDDPLRRTQGYLLVTWGDV
jgi:hypothetical protein